MTISMTISSVASVATVAISAIVSVARLGSSSWLSLPLAIIAMVSVSAISVMAVATMSTVAIATIAVARLSNNHSEEGEGKKDQEFHDVLCSSFSEVPVISVMAVAPIS